VANGNGSAPPSNAALAAALRQTRQLLNQQSQSISVLQQMLADLASKPRSVQEEIDAIPGRRIESILSGEITFTAAQAGQQGNPITITVSQDGPFVMTHYPQALWRPSSPANATNFGIWRPVRSFPLPTQQVTSDFIDILYQIFDAGAGRLFQNAPRGPLFSQPDSLLPCPIPTLWSPNSTIQFVPTYNAINFNSGGTATTGGTLHVDLIGYRVVNL